MRPKSSIVTLVFFLACLAIGSPISGQIISQQRYDPFTLITLDVEPKAGATFRSVKWLFDPPKISGHQCPDGQMIFTAPPGQYKVVASVVTGTIDGEKITTDAASHNLFEAIFQIGDPPTPEPDDDTDPQPPTPIVVVENARVLIFEESSERTADTAKMLADATFWKTVTDRGMLWRIYDIDSADAKPFADKIKPIGLPTLVITAKDGKVLSAAKLPKTNADVDAAIKQATGK